MDKFINNYSKLTSYDKDFQTPEDAESAISLSSFNTTLLRENGSKLKMFEGKLYITNRSNLELFRKEVSYNLDSLNFKKYWNKKEKKFTDPISYYGNTGTGYKLKFSHLSPVEFFFNQIDISYLNDQQINIIKECIEEKLIVTQEKMMEQLNNPITTPKIKHTPKCAKNSNKVTLEQVIAEMEKRRKQRGTTHVK